MASMHARPQASMHVRPLARLSPVVWLACSPLVFHACSPVVFYACLPDHSQACLPVVCPGCVETTASHACLTSGEPVMNPFALSTPPVFLVLCLSCRMVRLAGVTSKTASQPAVLQSTQPTLASAACVVLALLHSLADCILCKCDSAWRGRLCHPPNLWTQSAYRRWRLQPPVAACAVVACL